MAFRSLTSSTGATTSVVLSAPAGVAAGDDILIIIAGDINASGAADPTWDTGFSTVLKRDLGPGSGGIYLFVGKKKATGSEPGSYTTTLPSLDGDWTAHCVAYSGRSTGSANASSTAQVTGATTGTALSQSLTPTVNNCDVVWIALTQPTGGWSGGSVNWTVPASPAFTKRADTRNTNWSGLAFGDYAQTTAAAITGASGSCAFTAGSAFCDYIGALIALAPAATAKSPIFYDRRRR